VAETAQNIPIAAMIKAAAEALGGDNALVILCIIICSPLVVLQAAGELHNAVARGWLRDCKNEKQGHFGSPLALNGVA
jgi:hypothetical protein